jgi:hypothetical protein
VKKDKEEGETLNSVDLLGSNRLEHVGHLWTGPLLGPQGGLKRGRSTKREEEKGEGRREKGEGET